MAGPAADCAATAIPAAERMYSSMSVFRFSERVPKIACMPLPTFMTPAAPSALRSSARASETLWRSTRRRVMQASSALMLPAPPNAATRRGAIAVAAAGTPFPGISRPPSAAIASSVSAPTAAVSSSSRPGVLRLKRVIIVRNSA